MSDLERTRRALAQVARTDVATPLAEALGDVWADTARRLAPVDTGQLRARTRRGKVTGGRNRAEVEVEADTPYAGMVEFGTRFQPAQPYFRPGRDQAAKVAGELGGQIESDLRRVLSSGGVWNPRRGDFGR